MRPQINSETPENHIFSGLSETPETGFPCCEIEQDNFRDSLKGNKFEKKTRNL